MQGLHALDSRGLATLLKDLGKQGLPHRATQLFDILLSRGGATAVAAAAAPRQQLHQYQQHQQHQQHAELAAVLLDEFTFTAMISNCVGQQDLARALALAEVRAGPACHNARDWVVSLQYKFPQLALGLVRWMLWRSPEGTHVTRLVPCWAGTEQPAALSRAH